MRRSTRDIRLGRALAIGQTYRHRETGQVWIVWQIHRADCQVELRAAHSTSPATACIRFAQLREQWDLVIPLDQLEAVA